MEKTEHLLDLLNQPAFSVKHGTVIYANHIAKGLHIDQGDPIESMIPNDMEDYRKFQGGCLYLTVKLMDVPYGATVTRNEETDIFVLDDPDNNEHLHAMARAGQHLRLPLTNILTLLDTYFKNAPQEESFPATKIKHNAFQLYRMISNMCDAATWSEKASVCETGNIAAIFREVMDKSAATLDSAKVQLQYKCPNRPILSILNQDMVERALLNMISNACKFADPGSLIEAELLQAGNQVRICIKNQCAQLRQDTLATAFNFYTRKSSVEDPRHGIGLGMTMIRSAAITHGGTVLIDQPEPSTVRVSMTLAIRKPEAPAKLRSPSCRLSNYAGGFDLALLELSQLLPDENYETK